MLSRRGASDPGRLRLRLTLEHATVTPDGAGGSALSWSAVATVPADVIAIAVDERAVSEGVADVTQHRIVIRRRSDVSTGDRFRLGNRLFRIRSLTDPHEDGRYLVCLCEEEGRE